MILFVMGVCGSGKSTIGQSLAKELKYPFFDGDDFHPQANIDKMCKGQPLNDDDRQGWLQALNQKAKEVKEGVFACSALKESYRQILFEGIPWGQLVYLNGSFELIDSRMKARKDHFMPPGLLTSQFQTLEEPEYGLNISIDQEPEKIVEEIMENLSPGNQEFGLIGLGVMGKSLARNLAGKGFKLALYNRFVKNSEEQVAEKFIEEFDELNDCKGFEDLGAFVNSLSTPRKIFLMVNAGKVTDLVIEELKPLLDKGDIIIDGGNSHFADTQRRMEDLKANGLHFIGTGVSGGEEGALKGPSIMPGGDKEAYQKIAPYLEAIAARDAQGNGCCTYIGKGGSGHFVKMVHNGIEYAEMQLLAEVYALLRYVNGLSPEQISAELQSWETNGLSSYLLEITHKLLLKKEGEAYLVDLILDKAGNKGTGSWTTISMAELGIPATMISSALFARYISSFKQKRERYQKQFDLSKTKQNQVSTNDLRNAYQLARLVNHQQGFELINEASKQYQWELNLPELARIWTNGCIIRSELMEELIGRLKSGTDFLLTLEKEELAIKLEALKAITIAGIQTGVSLPTHLSAMDYLNALLFDYPTANIIQAQRDFFGAHTYKRVDDPEGPSHHTVWE
ncbi:NADP-dependent phosphogluconate dehydrogenase [Jiulongibacter sediminis]|uniref:NADP-dependent phosphogluconate dehydrogenase n=1 Tax=Jiulongibacter sediminis TaxID=1605367 RepID=UPI0026EA4307|nr:NADP-dependent phosphogluconate dehydrogenase [Jiulongibacter sediminis]